MGDMPEHKLQRSFKLRDAKQAKALDDTLSAEMMAQVAALQGFLEVWAEGRMIDLRDLRAWMVDEQLQQRLAEFELTFPEFMRIMVGALKDGRVDPHELRLPGKRSDD
jgi:Flp pilus assembly protein TadB